MNYPYVSTGVCRIFLNLDICHDSHVFEVEELLEVGKTFSKQISMSQRI